MDRWITLVLVLLGLVAVVLTQGVQKFRCYQCNSYMQDDCADHFNNQTWHLTECPDNVTMCRKIVQEVYYNDQWNLRYIRQCAASGEVGGDEGRHCIEKTGTYKVKVRICHCDNQEGCNTATSLNGKLTVFVMSVIFVLFSIFRTFIL